jgi:hypothetical protein
MPGPVMPPGLPWASHPLVPRACHAPGPRCCRSARYARMTRRMLDGASERRTPTRRAGPTCQSLPLGCADYLVLRTRHLAAMAFSAVAGRTGGIGVPRGICADLQATARRMGHPGYPRPVLGGRCPRRSVVHQLAVIVSSVSWPGRCFAHCLDPMGVRKDRRLPGNGAGQEPRSRCMVQAVITTAQPLGVVWRPRRERSRGPRPGRREAVAGTGYAFGSHLNHVADAHARPASSLRTVSRLRRVRAPSSPSAT